MELRLRHVTSAGQSQSGDRYVSATFPLVSQGCAGSNWYNGKGSSQRLKMESCIARREISAVRSCRQAIRLQRILPASSSRKGSGAVFSFLAVTALRFLFLSPCHFKVFVAQRTQISRLQRLR